MPAMSDTPPPIIELRFQPGQSDYLSYAELLDKIDPQSRSRWGKFRKQQQVMFAFAILAAAWCTYAFFTRNRHPSASPGPLPVLGFCVILYLWWWCWESVRVNLPRTIRRKREIWARDAAAADNETSRTLTFAPSGVRLTTSGYDLVCGWPVLPSIWETPVCIVIPMPASTVIILPKRVIGGDNEIKGFLRTIRSWQDAANPNNHGRLLRTFLAEADVPCPVCDYNLRGIQGQECPECGRPLEVGSLQSSIGRRIVVGSAQGRT
jgi:hypothetical protein